MEKKDSAARAVREIRRKTRRRFSADEKIRIVIEGLRGEESIAGLCRREEIANRLVDDRRAILDSSGGIERCERLVGLLNY